MIDKFIAGSQIELIDFSLVSYANHFDPLQLKSNTYMM